MKAKIKIKSEQGQELIRKGIKMLRKQYLDSDGYCVDLHLHRNGSSYVWIQQYKQGVQVFSQEITGRELINNMVGLG